MNRFTILFTLLASSGILEAAPQPILVIRERDPWRSVMGSDSANLAIYDDGSVIYLRSEPTPDEPFAQRTVEDPMVEAQRLLGFDLTKVEGAYELSSATDQIETTIWTAEKTIEIYGNWREPPELGVEDDPQWKAINEQQRKMWESLPPQIRQALERIQVERKRTGQAWFPPNVEVMFWPYEYAPDDSIIWPVTWPDLKSATTKKRGEDAFSVYLPAEQLPELRKFLASRKEKGAVLIDGKKMSASYRFPFVGENLWMR